MRNALVTGATRGIGLAIASTLAAKGDRVVAIGPNRNPTFDAAVASVSGADAIEFEALVRRISMLSMPRKRSWREGR